jgi:Protein of unknown function (DUF3108)
MLHKYTKWGTDMIAHGEAVKLRCGRHDGGCRGSGVSVFAAAMVLWSVQPATAAGANQSTVAAHYDISFAGVRIGKFNFNSKIQGANYSLTSNSKVKVLFGAFRWRSASRTVGVVRRKATPKTFSFDYRIKKKRKVSEIRFARGNVVQLDNQPPLSKSRKYVPLLPQHLRGVVDPMTAIMQMTQATKGNPCHKKIEVFDGRMRLQLTLSPKGRRRIKDSRASGQPNFGYVCKVSFRPIAGYKRSSNIKYIAGNTGIEIVLRPVPAAGVFVPYQILVPTMVGSVSIAARKINIVHGRNQRIALKH